MEGAATGEARFPALGAALGAATYALELLAIAIAYFGLGLSGLLAPASNPSGTLLWPPTGVALALVLLRGYRIWPAILAGSFCFAAAATPLVVESGAIGCGTTLAALAGAWALRRLAPREDKAASHPFAAPGDIARFAAICLLPTALISSGVATAGLFLAGDASFGGPAATWLTWWLADAAGTVLVAPAILLWALTPSRGLFRSSTLETLALCLAAAAIGFLAFAPISLIPDGTDPLPYRTLLGFLILVPLLRAALNANQRDAATAALIFCGMAVWGFAAGIAPFGKANGSGALLLLGAVAASTALVPLVVGAGIAAHQEAEAHLHAARNQLTRQIEETRLAFQITKRHFQIFLDGVADYAIFLLDASGRVASWNASAQRIIGYSNDEIIGKHFGIFYRPDERRAGEPNRALELAIQHGKHEVEGWRMKKNGSLFFVTGALTAIRDDDGALIGLASIIRDATERRDTQEKLVEAREQLAMAQKMEAIGKLTGGIAHDFNNLLMIIGGNAQTFRRLLDPKLPKAIEAIQTAAKRGESLTRQLLTFSRRQHLSPTVFDLNASIRNMRTMIESSLRGNIVYNERLSPGLWPVKVDLAELELAIVNIAVNARDAMPNGGTFTLTAGNVTANDKRRGVERGESYVAISFSDTGMGIPPNLLSKIFDPFFTTKEVGKGTGLGLSQVYGFAHQAGGTVHAESKVGHGTTVTVYLPRCIEREIPVKEEASGAHHSQRPMALIVDDSAEVAEVTASLFEYLGYDTVYRDSAEAALKLLAEGGKIDLVFSDIVMPGTIDGVGLASEIRTQYPHLPVILTTGYSDAAQAAPPDLKILRKPFDTEALRGFIQDAMNVSLAS